MSTRGGGANRVEGTDGSDFGYRQQIEDRYFARAQAKERLKIAAMADYA